MSDEQGWKNNYEGEKRALKHRYLKRAFKENRGAEVIAKLNQHYNNVTKTKAPSDDEICAGLAKKASSGFNSEATMEGLKDAAGTHDSKYVRAHNMAQYLEGSPYRWREESSAERAGRKSGKAVVPGPNTLQ